MNGVLIVNKKYGVTSRDVVNDVVKKLNIKKVGHTGTLDPIATGVLVICVGSATKLVSRLTSLTKEYIATVTLGVKTDTLDNTGNILEDNDCIIEKHLIEQALNKFKCTYNQEVPIYSAVKINGKKLYEYAKENIEIELPKREVTIYDIELLEYNIVNNKTIFKFKCLVSKGTYIRSLIRDISESLNTNGIMTSLIRTKQGDFNIKYSINIEDVDCSKLIQIKEVLNIEKIELTPDIEKKVLNGAPLNLNKEEVLFTKDGEEIAIYKRKDNLLKCDVMFKGGIL